MKSLTICWVALIPLFLFPAMSADAPQKAEVDWTPFEPPCQDFFSCQDKFRHPAELVSPQFLYPFEMRWSAIDGEVVVLVKIDDTGKPKRLSVLSGTHQLFIRSTIFALETARWATGQGNVCFYYKAVFTLKDPGGARSR